jgi:hypothetical protein
MHFMIIFLLKYLLQAFSGLSMRFILNRCFILMSVCFTAYQFPQARTATKTSYNGVYHSCTRI